MSLNKTLNCRMYVDEYPNVDDLVVVQVKSIVEMGAYCKLLEYNDIEGMILMSELSRRRIRSVNRLIRVGRQEIVSVLRVNKEKGYIDLSKKRVTPDDIKMVDERWNKSKAVHSIMRYVARNSNYGTEELYELFGWPIAAEFGHTYNGFKKLSEYYDKNEEKNMEQFISKYNIPNDIKSILLKQIGQRLKPQNVNIRCIIECTCFAKCGIIGIKNALKKGEKYQSQLSDQFHCKIQLKASPIYIISCVTPKQQKGIEYLNEVIKVIKDELTKNGGHLSIKQQPKVEHQNSLNINQNNNNG